MRGDIIAGSVAAQEADSFGVRWPGTALLPRNTQSLMTRPAVTKRCQATALQNNIISSLAVSGLSVGIHVPQVKFVLARNGWRCVALLILEIGPPDRCS